MPSGPPATTALDEATVERLLTTTRAVRRGLDFDRPVSLDTIRDCIRLAQHAPSAENLPLARWVVVHDPARRAALAAVYARGVPGIRARAAAASGEAARRLYDAAEWLAHHLARVPVLVVPCLAARPPAAFSAAACATLYGSVLPAVWSFQLALRARGLASVFTTLHLAFEEEARRVLDVPADALQVALLPVAHARTPNPRPAARPPVTEVAYLDAWGRPFPEDTR